MEYILSVMGILASIYGFWQSYKSQEELVGILESIPHKTKEEFVKENLVNLATGKTAQLLTIRQSLIHIGEIALAEQINEIIDGEFKLSKESFYILKSYISSKQFSDDLKHLD